MKNRIGVIAIVLVLVCVGLGIALVAIKNQAADEQLKLTEQNVGLSNTLAETNVKLDKHKQVIAELNTVIDNRIKEAEVLTNKYVESLATLTQVSNNWVKTEVALKASQEETAKRDAKIVDLQTQNQKLDKQTIDLSAAITNLTIQIEETKHKLATSEGEKGFLGKELRRLMAEKAELEKQFNDLAVLRAQVSKLKQELSVARRLEWIRQGLFAASDQKGAQKLMQGVAPAQPKAPKPNFDLNVEIGADGSVKVIPPLTNRPAATNPPAK